jgi:hypothetical protein
LFIPGKGGTGTNKTTTRKGRERIRDSTAITASEKNGVEIYLVLTESQVSRKSMKPNIAEEEK